jgi:hypothetical protein
MTREKGHATVLFSREELLLMEFCVLYAIDMGALDEDTLKDASDVVREIRKVLGNDAQSIADRLTEKLAGELDERSRPG